MNNNVNNSIDQKQATSQEYAGNAIIVPRVSSLKQSDKESSIPDQTIRCQELVDSLNLKTVATVPITWSAWELEDCPEYQELCRLVDTTPNPHIIALKRDRLSIDDDGLSMLNFQYRVKEAGGCFHFVTEPDIIDGPMSMVVEAAFIAAKTFVNERNRQGAIDGLRARALNRGLPINYNRIYGYKWIKAANGQPPRLVPDEYYDNAELILDLSQAGCSQPAIRKELKRRDICSPSNQPEWSHRSISRIQRNPVYAGRVHALTTMAVTPKKRRADAVKHKFGKSSTAVKPLEQAHWLKDIVVERPIMTWEEREALIKRLDESKYNSARNNNKNTYRYGQHIYCDSHKGQRGEPRKLHGVSKRGRKYYVCPVAGCHRIPADGPDGLDARIDIVIKHQLLVEGAEGRWLNPTQDTTSRDNLVNELKKLDADRLNIVNAQSNLETERLLGKHSQEVYEQVKSKLDTKLKWVFERAEAIGADLDNLADVAEAQQSLKEIIQYYRDRIDYLSTTEWRQLLDILRVEIHIPEDMLINAKTLKNEDNRFWYEDIVIDFAIPLDDATRNKRLGSILGHGPCPARSNRYFPVSLSLSQFITEIQARKSAGRPSRKVRVEV